jgi:hypothetical protein
MSLKSSVNCIEDTNTTSEEMLVGRVGAGRRGGCTRQAESLDSPRLDIGNGKITLGNLQ